MSDNGCPPSHLLAYDGSSLPSNEDCVSRIGVVAVNGVGHY